MPSTASKTTARIAVCTDVHANLPALDAALAAIGRLGADALYHTGDAIGIGPYPVECLDRLLSRPDTHLLIGNHDEWFAFGLPPEVPPSMSADEREHQRWVHAQLDPALRRVVGAWPYASTLRIEGVRIDFLHYALGQSGHGFQSPRDLSSPDTADALFQRAASALVFFGHDHRPWNVHGRSTHYVNPGALGCSAEPLARFAMLEVRPGGTYDVTFHAVPYDPAPVFAELERRRVPARDFITRTFLPWPDGPSAA